MVRRKDIPGSWAYFLSLFDVFIYNINSTILMPNLVSAVCICICRKIPYVGITATGGERMRMLLIFTESWFKCFQGRSVYNVTTEIIPLGNTAWIKRVLGAVIICADGLVFQWVASCRALGTDKFRGWHGHEPMRDVIHHRHSLAISSVFKWRPAQFFHECSRTDRWIPPRLIIYDVDCASVDLF